MMRYKLLGNSGLRVSELALGTMTFGTDWGWGADKETSRRIFDAFVEAGGNFIDTSNNYTNGSSEQFVGEFVAGNRDRFVIATKYTLRLTTADEDNFNEGGNSRKSMVRSVERSLQTLNTDYIDLRHGRPGSRRQSSLCGLFRYASMGHFAGRGARRLPRVDAAGCRPSSLQLCQPRP